jgi:hypothetical protein
VAASAIDDTRFDIDVSLVKSWPLVIVAFSAQGLNGLIHQGSLV